MKKYLSLILSLVSLMMLTGCQDEEFGYTSQEIAYETAFKKMFPNIDPEHTWSTAVDHELTVTTDSESDIRVYSIDGKVLLACYRNVMGDKTIVYDTDLRTTKVMVTDGRMAYVVGVEDHVNFGNASTRAAIQQANVRIDMETVKRHYSPMGNNFLPLPQKAGDRRMYRSTGEVTIFADPRHEFGIFYFDANDDIVRVPGNAKLVDGAYAVRMTIPENMVFGVYQQVNGHYVYSDSELNEGGVDDGAGFTGISVMTRGMADEDPGGSMNPNAGSAPYFFAFEDLGGAYEDLQASEFITDLDFNDVVLRVDYTPAETTGPLQITLKAAGGTLPVTASYVGTGEANDISGSQSLFGGKELHKAFADLNGGVTVKYEEQPYSPINVNAEKDGASCSNLPKTTFDVPGGFSVARYARNFMIYVTQKSGVTSQIRMPYTAETIPQVILIRYVGSDPEVEKNWEWEWPNENVCISQKFPVFSDWVTNHVDNSWPNFMWDAETDAIIYESPYFFAKIGTLTLNKTAINEETTIEILPKSAFVNDYAFVTSSMNPSLVAVGDNTSGVENKYDHTVTANKLYGQTRIQVTLVPKDPEYDYLRFKDYFTITVNEVKGDSNNDVDGGQGGDDPGTGDDDPGTGGGSDNTDTPLYEGVDYGITVSTPAQDSDNDYHQSPTNYLDNKAIDHTFLTDFNGYSIGIDPEEDEDYTFELICQLQDKGPSVDKLSNLEWGYYYRDENDELKFKEIRTGVTAYFENNHKYIKVTGSLTDLRKMLETDTMWLMYKGNGNSLVVQTSVRATLTIIPPATSMY